MIERVAYRATGEERTRLLDLLDGLEVVPVMHRLRELSARQRIAAGEIPLTADQDAELRRLFGVGGLMARLGLVTGTTVTDAMDHALRRAQQWKQLANDAGGSSTRRDVAAITSRSYELLWQELVTSPPAVSWPPPAPSSAMPSA